MHGNNPLAYAGPITLDTLDDLFAHHRERSGGWSMVEPDAAAKAAADQAAADAAASAAAAKAAGGGGGGDTGNAKDNDGKDLGYPANTRVAEMTDAQAAAYWRYHSQKHEGRYKGLVGDRSSEDVKKDLDELAELKKQQQTPAEQALTAAREEGKAEATKTERSKTAETVFRGSLEAAELPADDIEALVKSFNVTGYITDDGVDTAAITTFAKRFTPAGTATRRERDFGGGKRGSGTGKEAGVGSAGKAEAQRRFAKTKSGE